MHRGARSAAFVAALAVSTAGHLPAAEARTPKELNVCWVNSAPKAWLDLEIVVDGPSFKTASLDAGDCIAWDIRPGQYKLTVEDLDEFEDAMAASCAGRKQRPSLKITVERQQELYKTDLRALQNGGVLTNVRKDRRTTVVFILSCIATT